MARVVPWPEVLRGGAEFLPGETVRMDSPVRTPRSNDCCGGSTIRPGSRKRRLVRRVHRGRADGGTGGRRSRCRAARRSRGHRGAVRQAALPCRAGRCRGAGPGVTDLGGHGAGGPGLGGCAGADGGPRHAQGLREARARLVRLGGPGRGDRRARPGQGHHLGGARRVGPASSTPCGYAGSRRSGRSRRSSTRSRRTGCTSSAGCPRPPTAAGRRICGSWWWRAGPPMPSCAPAAPP